MPRARQTRKCGVDQTLTLLGGQGLAGGVEAQGDARVGGVDLDLAGTLCAAETLLGRLTVLCQSQVCALDGCT